MQQWLPQLWNFLELFQNLAGKTQAWLRVHPSERKCSVLGACAEYFCCFIFHSWGVLSSLPSGPLSKLLFFTSLPKENIPVFTDVQRGLERIEFNRDKEFKTVEIIKLLRQGQLPNWLSFSHSYISHVIQICSPLFRTPSWWQHIYQPAVFQI